MIVPTDKPPENMTAASGYTVVSTVDASSRMLFSNSSQVISPSSSRSRCASTARAAQGTNQNIIGVNLGYLCRVRLKFNVKLK